MMRTVNVLSLALGILLVGPVEAKPLHPHKPVHAQLSMFNPHADALAPETIVRWPAPFTGATSGPAPHSPHETDGLSRNSDDCNYGCIDH